MISLTHFSHGKRIALNAELIERIEETPDTVITLTTGARYLVEESLDEVIEAVTRARAEVLALARRMTETTEGSRLRLVRGDGRDAQEGDQ